MIVSTQVVASSNAKQKEKQESITNIITDGNLVIKLQ